MRKNALTLALVLTFVSAALAGCTGDGAAGEDPTVTDVPTEAGRGTLEVTIINELFNPLDAVTVTIFELKANKTTDGEGKATFTNLEPGRYTIYANKLGFVANAKSLNVVADNIAQVTFTLVAVPPPAQPYHTFLEFAGFISCSFGAKPIQAEDKCNDPNVGVGPDLTLDENSKSKFNFTLDKGATGAVVLLEEGSSGTNHGKTMSVTWAAPAGVKPQSFEGPTPLRRDYTFEENQTFTQTESEAKLDVRAASGDAIGSWQGASMVVLQKPFTLYVTIFYNGFPVPADYDGKGIDGR